HRVDSTVVHGGRAASRYNQARVLNLTQRLPKRGANIDRPSPARRVGRPANGHRADADQFEAALRELADLVGCLEALQNNVIHGSIVAFPMCATASPE